MADDAARHISQAKRFRRSLATGPTRLSASPIDGWRSDVHAAASVSGSVRAVTLVLSRWLVAPAHPWHA
jgi:hypothetical protein